MVKFRLYFDKDKEEAWLNAMADKGYAMTGFFAGFYTFDACEPGKYKYQVDFGDRFFSVSNNYREFMEETGAEIVQKWGWWTILRKPAAEGEFILYTDVDSQIENYTKIATMFKVVTIIELICFCVEAYAASTGNGLGILFMFVVGALVLVMLRVTVKTKQVIWELRERRGECVKPCQKKVSPLLLVGLFLNCGAIVIQDSVSYPIKLGVQILAILFMLVGLIQSRTIFHDFEE